MFYFHKDIIKGMRRRFKEVRLLAAVTLISVVFITASLIFQVNSETYLFEVNRVRYGDWVIAETIDDTDTYKQVFAGHSYFERYGTVVCGLDVTDEDGGGVLAGMGYVDDNLVEIGHIRLREGRLPEKPGEVVVVPDLLASMGYNLEVGQKITLNVKGRGINPVEKEYELVGVLEGSMSNWCVSGSMPHVLVAKEEAEGFDYTKKVRYFYELKERYKDIDTGEFYNNLVGKNFMSEDGLWCASYNDYLYSTSFWGEERLYVGVECMLILSGMAALSYCMVTYIQSRKKNYYCLRVIGMSKLQTKLVILLENVAVCLPVGLASMFGTLLLGFRLSMVLSGVNGIGAFYVVPLDTFLKILISWLVIIAVSVVIAIILTGQKKLYGNTKSVSIGRFKRKFLNRLKCGKVYSGLYKREQRVYSVRYGIGVIIGFVITGLLLYSGTKMWEAWDFYVTVTQQLNDFEGRKGADSGYASQGVYTWYTDMGDGSALIPHVTEYAYGGRRCTEGINEGFEDKLKSIGDIKSYYMSIYDNAHIFEWDNMMEDTYIQSCLNESRGGTSWRDKDGKLVEDHFYWSEVVDGNSLFFDYNSWFVSDTKEKYEYYSKKQKSDIMTYEGFDSGEQVFVILNRPADYINEGSNLRILAGDEAVTVQVGAVIPLKNMVSSDYPLSKVDTYDSGREKGVCIIASDALAEKIAQAEGGHVEYNLIDIRLSPFARYGITVKQCVNLLNDGGINTRAYYEWNMKHFDDMFTQMTMYGMFSVILVLFYIILKNNMVQSNIVTSGNRIKRLRMIGMSKVQVIRMYVYQGISESKWLVATLPLIYALYLYLIYDEYKGNHLRIDPTRFFVKELNEYVIYIEDIMRYTIDDHVNLLVCLGLIGLIVGINVLARYMVVKRYLKQENWISND